MQAREIILRAYAEWTAMSALRVGAPIRSREAIYGLIRRLDFAPITDRSRGRIEPAEFDRWHAKSVRKIGNLEQRLKGRIGWAAKIINIYLKTYAYAGDQGRPNLRNCLHPPIDKALWKGLKSKLEKYPDILADTHCVETIGSIDSSKTYERLIRGFRSAAAALNCSLLEVEQLWELPLRPDKSKAGTSGR
jgi:hypothetical protein